MSKCKLTGRIVTPGDPDYDLAREEFNTRYDLFPRIINFCQTTRDVSNAICWARAKNVKFRIRTGRHSYEAYSSLDGGLVIDISEINDIKVDHKKNRARLGAGSLLYPLYERLYEEGVTIPGGTCPSVGLSGLTLGGGWGMLTRPYGMLIDQLVEVEMVDARGRIVVANKEKNADLFWASRGGGGGNFGVVTSLVFHVIPIDQVSTLSITWDWKGFEPVVEAWQSWAPFTDCRLTAIIDILAKDKGELRALGEFTGSTIELWRLVQPLLDAYPPKKVEIKSVPYIDAVKMFGGMMPGMEEYAVSHGDPDAHPFKNTGAFAKKLLPPEGIRILKDFLSNSPSPDNKVQLQALSGCAGQFSPTETAYVHRKALFSLLYITKWDNESEANINTKWVEKLRNRLLPFADGAYVNFQDNSIKDWLEQCYFVNLPRLIKVKTKYDPENLFNFPLSIPVACRK
ncbi:FAD-binding protein [Fictibacillus nanhaiensis]|uniref:FAD-binding oxidoreductase n=1 Tax=Fictibacillus nanhaiensis TaxID=742169 RepID=UPI001C980E0A|nr:FAD-binding protein [Fictibacillus nanhaiensis]MBY6037967.1 FAD-binding protein [Fictibacillus nanhaiensis]